MLCQLRFFSAILKLVLEGIQTYDVLCDLVNLHRELHVKCTFLLDFVPNLRFVMRRARMNFLLLYETDCLGANRDCRAFILFIKVYKLG